MTYTTHSAEIPVTPSMTKEKAIREVLEKRIDVLDRVLIDAPLNERDRSYFIGKKEGYLQALDLLNETIECIAVELGTA